MDTTKKSTKAKIKTVAPKTRKSSSAVTKKTVSTKEVNKVSVKKTAVSNRTSRTGMGLRQLNLLSALAGLCLAAAAGVLMNTKAYQLFTGLLTRDELASQTGTVFAPAIHSLYDLELRWAVVAIMILSAIAPLVYLLFRKREESALNYDLHFWRWLETGIIAGLMVEVVALLSGIQDVMTLKLLGGMIVISSLLRWVAEKQQVDQSDSRRSTSALSIASCVLPGLLIGAYAIGTYVYGMVRSPWYVYALYATLVAGFIAYVLNLRSSVKRLQASAITQRNYHYVNLLTRVAFAVILIIGLKK